MDTLTPLTSHLLLVECPICDKPSPFDGEAGRLDCPACGVRLDVAADEPAVLAAAA